MLQRLSHLLRLAAVCAALTALRASTLRAQALRLIVTEEASARPVAGAVAEVLDSSGTVLTQGILSADGRRVLALPAGGRYRVRIRRIGFEPFAAAAPVIPATGIVDLLLALPARRVMLSTITVLARPVCARDAFRDSGVSTLWTEIRTALATTALSRTDSTLSLQSRSFRQHLETDLQVAEERVGLPRHIVGGKPYVSLSAEDLAENGYVRREGAENVFYAPDEAVLLSDQFVVDHCFNLQRGEGATEGLLGLRFQPAPRRGNDIAGTLWVDTASAELRYLDFWYANGSFPVAVVGEGRTGGQVLFERLPSGLWIVSAWRLRMPRFAEGRRLNFRSTPQWYEEFGGVVSSLMSDTLTPFGVQQPYRDMLAPARVAGVIYDSVAGRPLAGAHVWLLPEESAADVAAGLAPTGGRLAVQPMSRLTDVTGRFMMDSVPAGTWRLAFEHPDLDSLGLRMPFFDIRLRPGTSVTGALGVPSMATLRQGCASPPGVHAAGGMITGDVRASGDGRPLQGALVRASWTDLRAAVSLTRSADATIVETHTDSLGEYRLCGIPDSTMATVVAAGPHSATGGVEAFLGPLGITRVNLRLAEVPEGEAAPLPGTLVGTVRDSLGAAVVDAQVLLDGDTSSVRTDHAGQFRLSGVETGTQTIEVRRVGLEPARLVVNIVPGTITTVSLTLIKSRLLDPILVTAQRMRSMPGVSDAIRRHRTGVGNLMLEDEIARSATIQTLLQGIPGVRVAAVHGGIGWEALMSRGGSLTRPELVAGGECVARLFLDGQEVDSDVISSLTPGDIAALEVYVHATSAPIFTAGRSPYGRDELCGVILFWEKH